MWEELRRDAGRQVVPQRVKRICGGCANCTKCKCPVFVIGYFAQQWWCDCGVVYAHVDVGKGGRCFCSSDFEGASSTRERETVPVLSFGNVLAFASRSKAEVEVMAVQTSACVVLSLET